MSQPTNSRYEAAQAVRVPVKSSEDDENFVFDIQPNRVDTVKFVTAQRKLVDYVRKIFSHGYEIKHTYPERPEPLEAGEAGGCDCERDIYKVKMVMHREEEHLYMCREQGRQVQKSV